MTGRRFSTNSLDLVSRQREALPCWTQWRPSVEAAEFALEMKTERCVGSTCSIVSHGSRVAV